LEVDTVANERRSGYFVAAMLQVCNFLVK